MIQLKCAKEQITIHVNEDDEDPFAEVTLDRGYLSPPEAERLAEELRRAADYEYRAKADFSRYPEPLEYETALARGEKPKAAPLAAPSPQPAQVTAKK